MLKKINRMYGDDRIVGSFLTMVQKHRVEVFLYLKEPNVEKSSDKKEQYVPIQS
jgi:hypothetical protein